MTTNEKNHIRALRLFSERQYDGHHFKRIREHYASVREKHPYFCDMMMPRRAYPDATKEEIRCSLGNIRREIEVEAKEHTLAWDALLNCEMWEVYDALANDDKAQAVEELYDCISVCLRAIDVIEGRQPLGKPKTISSNEAEK